MKSRKKNNLTEYALETISDIPDRLPILPLRDLVLYPYMTIPLPIGRPASIAAVKEATRNGKPKYIFICTQRSGDVDEVGPDDIYHAGVIAKVVELNKMLNTFGYNVLFDCVVQAEISDITNPKDYLEGAVKIGVPESIFTEQEPPDEELTAVMKLAAQLFKEAVEHSPHIRYDAWTAFESMTDPLRKLFFAAANIKEPLAEKVELLRITDIKEQYKLLIRLLNIEVETVKLEEDIEMRVHETIGKAQRKFFIQEQIRALQEELGEDEEGIPEMAKMKESIESAGMPEAVKGRALEEFEKYKKTPSISPDAGLIRNYLEWLTSLPWTTTTDDNLDIGKVQQILDEDHYGLNDVKERITEYIAVLNLVGGVQGQTLCLSGPPGVGKTSLARSIARALGRKFVRISLGGVRDEAEIRGHRRTYIGALPGKIIQSMKRAGSINPVILLDEIDKMSADFRGDPSSALLEVLDPEQHYAFNDHYLEVDYDLSKVLFITTANVKYNIPVPLLDRMEIIELSSYLEHEKLMIGKNYLLPKQQEKNGLGKAKIEFEEGAFRRLIREYTKEAGVRNLERQIASILRKIAKLRVEAMEVAAAEGKKPSRKKVVVTEEDVERYLKAPKYKTRNNQREDTVGVATGLAWTSVGGDILPVEVTIMPGKDKITLTGKLGDVMKESAMAALSLIRSNADRLGVDADYFKDKDIHVHVPEGAIPKDGPSAGITMTMALLSKATGKAVRGDVAMTGEITLRGKVLAIGGLNEKLVAAKTAGISNVLVPLENKADVSNMNADITDGLNIAFVDDVFEALPHVFRS